MENKFITSLCYVHNKNDKTTVLCRFADYKDGTFVPFVYNSNQDFYGDDRDLLYGQNYEVLANEGEIAVFDWYAYLNSDNQWRTYVKRNNDISWCEVQNLVQYDSPVKIATEIKSGLSLPYKYSGNHDLILVSKTDSKGLNAIFLKMGNTKIKDNLLYFSDSAIKIPVGTIDIWATTGTCQCRYLQTEQKFLKWNGGFTPKMQYKAKKPDEVVRDIIQGNLGYFDIEVLSRREKQVLRSVLSRITEPTIVDLVCDKLKCSVQEAHQYIDQFIETANLKMEKQTALSVIEKLVESDVEAVLEMKKVVKEQWISENQTIIEEKKKEIQYYTEVLQTAKNTAEDEKKRVQQSVQAEEKKLNKTKKDNEELSKIVNDLKKLKDDLEKEIQERINHARTNLAGSLLDQALLISTAQPHQTLANEGKRIKTFSLKSEIEETEKAAVLDCHDIAVTDWTRVCGNEDMSSGLALLSLATFACNRSILVAGEGAETIADMLSVTVCGHKPLKLRISNDADPDDLATDIEKHDHQIICVINGIESGYMIMRTLMERFRSSRFIVTTLHEESLAMEPESLYTTFFPVLTDYFYNGRHVQQLTTLDCSDGLLTMEGSEEEKRSFRDAKRIVGKWLKDEYFPPLFMVRCAKLIASMMYLSKELDLSEKILRTAEFEFVLMPWLKCMRRKELFQRILEDERALDNEKKLDLTRYLGMDGI